MSEDLRKCCRICLDVESDHVPILGDPTIYLQIKSCLSMTVSAGDDLPKSVCTSCVAQLNDFYNFQLNARCSQDWLQSQLDSEEEQAKKTNENKGLIQPLPDSEYNSDSLLEFLNNTANIEEYLNNLGKEDIPSIVNILDRNQEKSSSESSGKVISNGKCTKQTSKIKETVKTKIKIDVLDSEMDIVKEFLKKESEPKNTVSVSKMVQKQSNISDYSASPAKQKLFQPISNITVHDEHSKVLQFKINQHSKPLDNVYRCKQCKATFKERIQMYQHAKIHVMKQEERVCDVCSQKFVGNEALDEHKFSAHGILKDQKYRCKICQHTTMDRKEIYMHVQNHCLIQEKEETKHLCESCGKSFATKATLLRHISIHTKHFTCNICQKTFDDIKSRDSHVLSHVDMTMCEKCGYLSSCTLEKHSCLRIL